MTRALAYTISVYTGQRSIPQLGRVEAAQPINYVPPVRQQTALQVSTHIQRRRKMVATVTQVDPPHPGHIQQRRKTVTVGTQVDPSHPITTPPDIWCVCRETEHGNMIFCENPGCLIEWFHMDCLHMDTAPESDWYCPNCSNIFD